MADAPNDYRDPKVTTTTEKKSNLAGIIAWTLLALGIIVLLLWLLGLFGDDEEVVVAPAPTTQTETVPVTPAPADDGVVAVPVPDNSTVTTD